MLLGRDSDFRVGYLVTARYLVVIASYCSILGGYCPLLAVTARYRSSLLVPTFSMNPEEYERMNIFEAGTSPQQQPFQNQILFNKGTSSKEVLFQNYYFLEKASFSEKQYSALPTLSGEPLFQCG